MWPMIRIRSRKVGASDSPTIASGLIEFLNFPLDWCFDADPSCFPSKLTEKKEEENLYILNNFFLFSETYFS